MLKLGIRHEDKYDIETRTPLIPVDVFNLVHEDQVEIVVEPSDKRVYSDHSFLKAGATIGDLGECQIIIGVKEVPVHRIEESKIYLIFSHVVKGQKQNMPALKKMIENKVTLIDYEKIVDEKGRRLIFFGRYAGLAGMINGLWCLGKRLEYHGFHTPFSQIQQARTYKSLLEVEQAVIETGTMIKNGGLSQLDFPVVIGITGNGNVSRGAWEILDHLPIEEISVKELLQLKQSGNWNSKKVYKVVFTEKEMVRPINPEKVFDLEDYYKYPSGYQNDFEQYLDTLTLLVNGTYWDDRYPRLLTKSYLKENYYDNHPLKVIADISCDVEGSIECTAFSTKPDDPVYTYIPQFDQYEMGFDHPGLLIMAVDILPSELPRDSSAGFSNALVPFIPCLVKADFSLPFESINLPEPVRKAVILYQGQLTPDFEYLKKHII
jgi:alanine dehydrogenase